jgi:2-methylcitrate dehydratase PrpD
MTTGADLHAWPPGPVSGAIGRFAAEAAWHELPTAARERATQLLTAALANARHGANAPTTSILTSYVAGLESPPEATLLQPGAARRRVGAADAALVNAAAAATTAHELTAPAVFAALAVAECLDVDGAALLGAIAVGAEIAARTAVGLGAAHTGRGWDVVGTAGRIGAAAAAARLFGLEAPRIVDALGYAATSTAGVTQPPGSPAIAIGSGKAAADAVEAGLLARGGLIGPPAPIEGRRGMFALEAGESAERVVEALGDEWLMVSVLLPSTPANGHDALLAVVKSSAGDPATLVEACCK